MKKKKILKTLKRLDKALVSYIKGLHKTTWRIEPKYVIEDLELLLGEAYGDR